MGQVTEILRTAYDKLAERPDNWTTHAYARSKNEKVAPISRGYSWCAFGITRWAAIQKGIISIRAASRTANADVLSADRIVSKVINNKTGVIGTALWNDSYATYPEVLDVFELAVKEADEQGL